MTRLLMAIMLTVIVGCGSAPNVSDCGTNADCADAVLDPSASSDESTAMPIGTAAEGSGEDALTEAPEPVPAAGIPAEPSPPNLDRLLFPTFGESLFDFILPGMFTDGGSLLFGDDEPITGSGSQSAYLERLCRRLGQPDFVCRQRYGN